MISRKAFQVTEITKMSPVAAGATEEHICDALVVGSGAAGLASAVGRHIACENAA
jgi:hypothetical protein